MTGAALAYRTGEQNVRGGGVGIIGVIVIVLVILWIVGVIKI